MTRDMRQKKKMAKICGSGGNNDICKRAFSTRRTFFTSHILYRPSFTPLDLASRKQHCSHLYHEAVDSLEQVESMRLAHRCSAMGEKVKRVTGVDWSWCLHQ